MLSAVRPVCFQFSGLWALGFKHTYQANLLHSHMLQPLHLAMYSTVKTLVVKKFWEI